MRSGVLRLRRVLGDRQGRCVGMMAENLRLFSYPCIRRQAGAAWRYDPTHAILTDRRGDTRRSRT